MLSTFSEIDKSHPKKLRLRARETHNEIFIDMVKEIVANMLRFCHFKYYGKYTNEAMKVRARALTALATSSSLHTIYSA